MTGSIDDSSLVAPRWHPPELRGGIVLRFLLAVERRRRSGSAQFQKFATDAVKAILIAIGVGAGNGGGRRGRQ